MLLLCGLRVKQMRLLLRSWPRALRSLQLLRWLCWLRSRRRCMLRFPQRWSLRLQMAEIRVRLRLQLLPLW